MPTQAQVIATFTERERQLRAYVCDPRNVPLMASGIMRILDEPGEELGRPYPHNPTRAQEMAAGT